MPWVAGKSGNPLGRPPDNNSIKKMLERIGNQIVDTSVCKMRKAELMWIAIYNEAIKGDVKAATAIADRLEGRPQQTIITTDIDLVEQNRIMLAEIAGTILLRDNSPVVYAEVVETQEEQNESQPNAEGSAAGESDEDSATASE